MTSVIKNYQCGGLFALPAISHKILSDGRARQVHSWRDGKIKILSLWLHPCGQPVRHRFYCKTVPFRPVSGGKGGGNGGNPEGGEESDLLAVAEVCVHYVAVRPLGCIILSVQDGRKTSIPLDEYRQEESRGGCLGCRSGPCPRFPCPQVLAFFVIDRTHGALLQIVLPIIQTKNLLSNNLTTTSLCS